MNERASEASESAFGSERRVDDSALFDEEFEREVRAARIPKRISAKGEERLMIDVARIPGALRLPRSLVRLLENVVRRAPSDEAAVEAARRVVDAGLEGRAGREVEFSPARVLFQDFTGVPIFVDFAAMRDAMVERGGDPRAVNPRIPCVLVVDHSVQADVAGCAGAAERNLQIEAERNAERFSFLKWASESFSNVAIVPPGQGICHQLNVERFASVVATDALWIGEAGEPPMACFDTVVGSDSHTTTVNGLGVLGWGLGGIECEAAALGLSLPMNVPEVVALELTGSLGDGVQAMDLALTVCELLREENVVGKIVEITGDGVASLSVTQRACVANMTPEYGATATVFPIDDELLAYLELTGRPEAEVALVGEYARAQGVFGVEARHIHRTYAKTLSLDLSSVVPSLAGPSRPHDRVTPAGLRERFREAAEAHGHGDFDARFSVETDEGAFEVGHGALGIAAITSCTTATDAAMVIAAGLVAKRARELGLTAAPWVKRILAPGSRATTELLDRAGLSEPLAELGFATCGWGCLSCIGNSGPILPSMSAIAKDLEISSILSGNRNFEGRISPDVAQNYLSAPAMVVAYALKGTVDADLSKEPVGVAEDGTEVMLCDLMPSTRDVDEVLGAVLTADLYEGTRDIFRGDATWELIETPEGDTYPWDPDSTYIRRPPYFEDAKRQGEVSISGGRCLALLGDFVTTDHISPAGSIAPDSPAARYLEAHGVQVADFNTYGARRGNHEVMERGTFANVRLVNAMADGRQGGYTTDPITGEIATIWDAAESARKAGIDLLVIAGKMYGSGSSRDWAAKGPLLQGVRCVVAESFERIHRSNLVGMGILPLEADAARLAALHLKGDETFDVEGVRVDGGRPAPMTTLAVTRPDGSRDEIPCRVRIDTPTEALYMAKGGILPYVLDTMIETL